MSNSKPKEPSISGGWPNFEKVYRTLVKLMELSPESEQFPPNKLRDRLINIGLKDFLDGVPLDDDVLKRFTRAPEQRDSARALEVYGFPFKFTSQWDEAVLALAHFLNRFRKEDKSKLEVCAIHLLSKGEDKTLSDWQSAKAKLYLELQNMILLLNGVGGRQSRVRRIFAFSKIADIAFLTQSAISLLNEQIAAGIGIGFLFVESFEPNKELVPISNGLFVNFKPNPNEAPDHTYHFYTMYELLNDERKGHDLPYQERCATKWFKNSERAFQIHPWVEDIFDLFPRTVWERPEDKWERWEPLEYKNPTKVYSLPGSDPSENQIFNSAVVMMAKVFAVHEGANIDTFNRRINDIVITGDWIRLQRAISAFGDPKSSTIWAVDATSVKNSLTIHESDPTYRHWLRTSLSRVLSSSIQSPNFLRRIYILDDGKKKGTLEFRTLLREMQYYLDYFHYEISEMSAVIGSEDVKLRTDESKRNSGSLENNWVQFKDRINVYVTTTTILEELASKTIDQALLQEIVPDKKTIVERLQNVDFISSRAASGDEAMIYNFLNQRADPGELKFRAFLFRQSLNTTREEQILFGFRGDLENTPLQKPQEQYRLRTLAESIRDYESAYEPILKREIDKTRYEEIQRTIDEVKTTLKDRLEFDESDRWQFLRIREAFETTLYRYFEKRFAYLYCFLRHYSLEVGLFNRVAEKKVDEINPFINCENAQTLTERIRDAVATRGDPLTLEEIQRGQRCDGKL